MITAPTRFELSLRDCYYALLHSMRIRDHPRAARFAAAIVKHARSERVPDRWLANAVAVVRAFGKGENHE